jgi:hypothetical protein
MHGKRCFTAAAFLRENGKGFHRESLSKANKAI